MKFADYYMQNNSKLVQCSTCVMDQSDPDIVFNIDGSCNYCTSYSEEKERYQLNKLDGEVKLKSIFDKMKIESRGGKYDCVVGLSGGIDSSYLMLLLKRFNVNPLIVHVDAGWNSEIAVSNIETLVKHCNFDLITHVVNWESVRKLQIAYFKSGISNLDVPQDHVFFAVLHKEAVNKNCKYFISGVNYASEYVFPRGWHGSAMDAINIKDVWKKHGDGSKLVGYQMISFLEYKVLFHKRNFKEIRPLNYINYNIRTAIQELENVGWRSYGRKHGESLFTRFFQNYLLPVRFGYDKRRPHLSSRILAEEITREDALRLLSEPLYLASELEKDTMFICNKLNVDIDFIERCLAGPKKNYSDYKNWDNLIKMYSYLHNLRKKMFG